MTTKNGAFFARENIMNGNPIGAGKTLPQMRAEVGGNPAMLHRNENNYGPSPMALEAIKNALGDIHYYPESLATEVRAVIADKLQVDKDMIIMSNGGDNILTAMAHSFFGATDEIIVGDPSFVVYDNLTRIMGAKIVKIPLNNFLLDLDAMLAAINENTKMILICNPNNPTGTILPPAEIEAFMEQVPDDILIVFDEAYIEFCDVEKRPPTLDYIRNNRNVMSIRTLSKMYGLAGLRFGYLIAPTHLIDVMRRGIEDFPINVLAQAAAMGALADDAYYVDITAKIKASRAMLSEEFTALGFDVLESQSNFIFVDMKMDTTELNNFLNKKGIFIRPGSVWNRPTFARITVGRADQCEALLAGIKEFMLKNI